MCLEVVAHPVSQQVTRKEHDGLLVDGHIAQARVSHLKQRVKHILDRLCTLGELVKHDDNRLAFVQSEAGVGIIARHLIVMVNHWHGNVAQVHVRHIHIGCVVVGQ